MSKKISTYSRGQLAKITGVKGETVRYYENCGLLVPPLRSTGGHRLYTEDHLGRLIFIRRARELGFSLGQIAGLLGLADARGKNCDEVRQATETHLSDVKAKIRDLKKMERSLRDLVQQCEQNSSDDCPIIAALSASAG